MPAVLGHSGALLLFVIVALGIAPAVSIHPASTVTSDLIDPIFSSWNVASVVHQVLLWRHGLWSFFDANIYYPTSHAAAYTDAAVGILPFSLLLHWLGLGLIAALNILIGLSFVLSAYGAFVLVCLLTGSGGAGLIAGLVVELWCGRPGWWTLAGLLAGLAAVTNLYYLGYLALPLGIVALAQRRAWTACRVCGTLLAAATATGLIGPFMIPYVIRHADVGARYGGAASLDLLSFLQVLPGRPIDSLLFPVVPLQMMQPNHGLFPGLVPLGLPSSPGARARRGCGRSSQRPAAWSRLARSYRSMAGSCPCRCRMPRWRAWCPISGSSAIRHAPRSAYIWAWQ